jgi:hypothetical protein
LTAISEASPTGLALCVIAVLALLVRERWPLTSFVATLPAVVFTGATVAAIVALYAVASRYRSWWLLAGCWLLAAGVVAFPMLDVAPQFWHTDMLLGVIYFTMTAGAPILLGRFLHSQRELALRVHGFPRSADRGGAPPDEVEKIARFRDARHTGYRAHRRSWSQKNRWALLPKSSTIEVARFYTLYRSDQPRNANRPEHPEI